MKSGIVFRRHGASLVPMVALVLADSSVALQPVELVSADHFERDFVVPQDDSFATIATDDQVDQINTARTEAARNRPARHISEAASVAQVQAATDAGVKKINDAIDRLAALLAAQQSGAAAPAAPAPAPGVEVTGPSTTAASTSTSTSGTSGTTAASGTSGTSTDPNDKGGSSAS